jgi:gluconolactonase
MKLSFRAHARQVIRWMAQCTPRRGCLEPKSTGFRDLFPENVSLQRVGTGFRFTEGPVWILEEKRLLFSDIPANTIYGLAVSGSVTRFREPSGNSNGLTRNKQGRLIACEHGNRRVTRTEPDGTVKPLAERFRRNKLNSPNDVVVKSDGAVYFTDPCYGIKPYQQEQPVAGVYRLSPDGSDISLVAYDFKRPNGLAFSPDEKKLYIDDSERRHIRVFDVSDDGSLSGGSLFHDMNVSSPGVPDGMKVDLDGRVYCTGAGGVWVFDSTGSHLGTIVTPEKPSNCAWGDDDWRSLYITAITSVYKIRVNTPGIRIP